uniref:Uncharacterized protein n=1 Tax=Pipistrellus kuhlii TaxID=59472 RepID=A0A7J7UG73_PIPKU|nr:hypothetical protein mPipKuh1_009071 [Pipistrellus kuhlii]
MYPQGSWLLGKKNKKTPACACMHTHTHTHTHTPQVCPSQKGKGKLRPREEWPLAQDQTARERKKATPRPHGPEPNAPPNRKGPEWPKPASRMPRVKVAASGHQWFLAHSELVEGQTLGAAGGGRPSVALSLPSGLLTF